jgi:hypothetical protein
MMKMLIYDYAELISLGLPGKYSAWYPLDPYTAITGIWTVSLST